MIINATKVGDGFSVKKKLIILLVLIGSLPVILTTVVTSYLSHNALVDAVYSNNRTMAESMAKEVNESIESKVNSLLLAASSSDIQSMDTARQLALMKKVAAQYQDMPVLIVADSQGNQTVRTEGTLSNIRDREYFKQVANGASFAISDVLVAKGTGKASVILAAPIRDASGFRGVLLGVYDLQKLSDEIAQIKIGQSGYPFMVDSQGKLIAHPNKDLVQQMADVSALEPVKRTMSGNAGVSSYEYNGEKKLAGYSFVPLSRWGLVVQQPLDEAMAGATKVRTTGIAFTLGAILLAVFVGIFAAGVLTRPIRDLVAATGKLAQGDLTAKASITTRDELGQLAESFNAMVDNLQELIRGVISTADQVAASSQELSATSNEAERAVNQIAHTMTDFAQGSQNQTIQVEKTKKVADDLAQISQAVAEKARNASALSAEMATAAETGGSAARNAVDKMTEIREVTAAASEVVTALGEKSKQIGQILDVITEIAGQTNLLALNAAIEAARAGEQGRGFAVVAEEVRKLAEQSQGAAQEIAGIVREIQDQTAEAISAMQSGSGKVNEGVDVVSTAGQALENILVKINSSVAMIKDINAATNQQAEGVRTMASGTDQVAVIAREASAGAETTAAASEEVSASMEEIASAAQSLAELAGELQNMVSKFKI